MTFYHITGLISRVMNHKRYAFSTYSTFLKYQEKFSFKLLRHWQPMVVDESFYNDIVMRKEVLRL